MMLARRAWAKSTSKAGLDQMTGNTLATVNDETTRISISESTVHMLAEETLLKAGALQRAIFNSANFSSIATDAKGVIQIFNVGAERMLLSLIHISEPTRL